VSGLDSITRSEQFVEEVVASQRRLYAYILTLVPDPNDAGDVLQQTNMALWRDSGRFQQGTNFIAWAFRIAYFKVLEHRKRMQRDRQRFRDTLLEDLAQESAAYLLKSEDARLTAMKHCLQSLPEKQQELVRRRYSMGESVQALATSSGQAANALANALYRIRRALWNCIEQRMATEDRS
jgi:RNA polymerase sigma-70 factor (ECF subfamily)